jgi:hypothetical protein
MGPFRLPGSIRGKKSTTVKFCFFFVETSVLWPKIVFLRKMHAKTTNLKQKIFIISTRSLHRTLAAQSSKLY